MSDNLEIDRPKRIPQDESVRDVMTPLPRAQVLGIVSMGDIAVARDRKSALGEVSAAPPNTHGVLLAARRSSTVVSSSSASRPMVTGQALSWRVDGPVGIPCLPIPGAARRWPAQRPADEYPAC